MTQNLDPQIDRETAMNCRAWPFEEAKKVLKRLNGKTPEKGYVLFQTGYGPSGLPHIGTFQEVARTAMVRHAFHHLSDIPTKLICFSDDMDGLRKVPGNVPNPEMLEQNLGKPLTQIPNPFSETHNQHPSFAHHNNAKLMEFLDSFGFEYEFISSTETYKSGRFDETLLQMLHKHEEIKKAVIPILGEERAKTYSPFLPLSPATGRVLQVPILEANPSAGTVVFEDEDGTKTEVPVTGGHCKAQWRPDWALRWVALDVDYEMAGEDLISAGEIAGKITKILGKKMPEGFRYKLFLDEKGEKISKSKGNGLTINEWLTYAPNESLSYYIFQRPTSGKKLYFDVIPKAVDEYISFLQKMPEQEPAKKLENPIWYIHEGEIPQGQETPVSFNLLLNLASASNAHDVETLWGFIKIYRSDLSPETHTFLNRLAECAVKYYEDFVLPTKQYRAPEEGERKALEDLCARLESYNGEKVAQEFQTLVFTVGKENGYEDNIKDWFSAIYQIVFGQDQGPRLGSFIEVYGVEDTVKLVRDALQGTFLKAA